MASRKVGYCKPPKHSQFKKGVSGNPQGRPKDSPTLAAVLEETLSETIVIIEDGERREVTKMRAAVQQLVDKAVGGDMHAFRVLSVLTQVLEESESRAPTADLAEADQKTLQSLFQRFTPAEA
jgi:hypothetical protein